MGNRLSRRNFLRRVIVAGTACAIPTIVPYSVFGASLPSERIALGFIGTGNQGIENIKAFSDKSGCEVVAVCDVDAARREKARLTAKLPAKSSYNDFRKLLTRNDIDAVVVSTPDHWHALVSIAAAKAGKDIYCEKPLAYNITEGRALCNAVRRYGRILQTGTQQRSDNKFRFACELVRNGRIGRVHTIKVEIPVNSRPNPLVWKVEPPPEGLDYDLWLGPAAYRPYIEQGCHYNWHFLYDFGSGQITNWGAHFIDIAQWGNGTQYTGPVEIRGKGDFPQKGLFETPLKVDVEYTYANGVKLFCRTTEKNETGDFGASTLFEGTDGWVFAARYKLDAHPKDILKSKIGPNENRLYYSIDHHQNFLDCVRSRRTPAADVEIGHRSASVCHLGDIAVRLGMKLKWDPQSECFIGNDNANKMLSRSMRPPWRL
jgi:predicted dehydrogenase